MEIAPLLDPDIKRRLKEINHHFFAEWDRKRNRWNIMAKVAGHPKRFVTAVKDERGGYMPIDGRIYSRLRKILWYNNRLKEYLYEIEEADRKMKEAKDERDYDDCRQKCLALRRPAQMLARELGIISGKARIPYSSGFGRGVLNVRAG